ncbi:gamma-interferon-inducible lysosomal thiol reductase-like, partial [Vombatus ursinus]|uniref:gamma-interferon-inducible lysosomal thiol reductase-like n=1 Tax=Vombatus ursinus TaxID=29139 RepID=UPI000FFD077A
TKTECLILWRPQPVAPVTVKLFYEALCPSPRSFMSVVLFPSWALLGNDVLDVVLVPFGNAEERLVNGTWEFTCQHGKLECKLNMIQVKTLLPQASPGGTAVINCMMSAAHPETSLESCLKIYIPQICVDDIMKCATGHQGKEMMHQNAMMTNHLSPPHTYTPWILVEEVRAVPYPHLT